MANTVGRVDILVDANGDGLPARVRRIARAAGTDAAREFAQSMQRGLGPGTGQMREFGTATRGVRVNLDRLRNGFRQTMSAIPGFDNLVRRLSTGFTRLRTQARTLGSELRTRLVSGLSATLTPLRALRTRINEAADNGNRFAGALRTTGERMRAFQARMAPVIRGLRLMSSAFSLFRRNAVSATSGLNGVGGAAGRATGQLRKMPYIMKTIIGYTLLFASLGGPIAALGSVAGSALLVLGTAVVALGVGVGVAVAGFRGMLGDISKVAPAARPAAEAIQAMAGPLHELQDMLQGRMFAGLGPQIQAMTASIFPALNAGLAPVADVLNNLMGQIASVLSTPEGAAELQALLAGFAPILQGLGDGFLQLIGAISALMTAALPMTTAFADAFSAMMTEFNGYLRSVEGQHALQDFFGTLATLMPTIIQLVGAAGEALADIVTPEVVSMLNVALQAFTQFMPVLSGLLVAVANLNPFGIIAELFRILGAALIPILPALQQLGTLIGDQLVSVLGMLAPVILQVMQAFAPFLGLLVQLVSEALPPLLEGLSPLIEILGQVASNVLEALLPAFSALIEALTPLFPLLTPIFDIFTQIATTLSAALVPFLTQVADVFVQLMGVLAPMLAEILPLLAQLLSAVFEAISPLIPVVLDLVAAFLPLLIPIGQLIATLLPPLISLLVLVISKGVAPLIGKIASLAQSFMPLVTTIISAVIPIIGSLTKILSGLIEFITGVFSGNWDQAWHGIQQVFSGVWETIKNAAKGALNIVVSAVNLAISGINELLRGISKLTGGAINVRIPKIPKLASGGILDRATHVIAGEAGPEAYVPLNRPLSQVDPSVRALSAFAQGKMPASQSGPTKIVTVESGAIQFTAANADGGQVGTAVLDRLIDNL